ncbi:MAG: hypothetical protein D4R82_00165 [Dehalococcoidia bacterium]|nr:MAG: hypothetical protein D4R82_00165 [Dehalococcoidia bacterium]
MKHPEMPVLKMPPKYICAAMQILYHYGENRSELREHVLAMFNSTDEKSVFRGMYVPTMRALGLTMGFGQEIRCSSNGRLLFEAYSKSNNEGKRVLGKLLVEIDEDNYNIVGFLKNRFVTEYKSIVEFITQTDVSLGLIPLSDTVANERIRKFMRYLIEGRIVKQGNSQYVLDEAGYQQTEVDTDVIKVSEFWNVLFTCYNSIKEMKAGFPSVPVYQLRNEVSKQFYQRGIALTEKEFDSLINGLQLIQSDYIIKFSRPMMESEKLLHLGGEVYSGMAIFKRE